MSCKSCVYGANTASQTVAAGSVVSFGSAVRQFGSGCTIDGGNVALRGAGYYDVVANVTVGGTEAGTAVIQLYKDGSAIPGAAASVVTTATSVDSVAIPAVVRETCCCESVITVVISGVEVAVTNAAIKAEKI